jgi:hypothetical protein
MIFPNYWQNDTAVPYGYYEGGQVSSMRSMADAVESKGRYGDTELVHMHPLELKGLETLFGVEMTTNPETGKREGLIFLLPMLAAYLGSMGAAAMGVTGTTLGVANASLVGALASGVTSGATTAAMGGTLEESLTSGAIGLGASAVGSAVGAAGESALGGATGGVTGAGPDVGGAVAGPDVGSAVAGPDVGGAVGVPDSGGAAPLIPQPNVETAVPTVDTGFDPSAASRNMPTNTGGMPGAEAGDPTTWGLPREGGAPAGEQFPYADELVGVQAEHPDLSLSVQKGLADPSPVNYGQWSQADKLAAGARALEVQGPAGEMASKLVNPRTMLMAEGMGRYALDEAYWDDSIEELPDEIAGSGYLGYGAEGVSGYGGAGGSGYPGGGPISERDRRKKKKSVTSYSR